MQCSPDEAQRSPGKSIEQTATPDSAALHPGYENNWLCKKYIFAAKDANGANGAKTENSDVSG
jgi:hypothetical protein